MDVEHQVGTHIPTEIVYEESPVGDSNTNGSIDRANQTIRGQIRAIKDDARTTDWCDDWSRQLSFEMACTSCGTDIDDIPRWQ